MVTKLQCLSAASVVFKRDNVRRVMALMVLCLLPFSVAAGEQKLVKISAQKKESRTEFFIENLQHADVTVTIEMDLNNLSASAELPYTVTVPPRSKVNALTVTPIDSKQGSDWSYTYYATWGNLTAKHDENHIYQLPYSAGMSFPVSQGFHGKYSHTGGDCYSIDFKMPEGTPVHAARDGVVVGIKDDSTNGGSDKKFEWDANYVLIQHVDGTLGHYVHLQKNGCRVKLGQKVQAGDWIGRSGNTGHSTGPHLHFAVFKAQNGKQRETVPIKYRTTPVVAEVLSEGRSYKAF
jgi:murein DD-endopeptidase MepM/ murein hydrolase activator NlpD